MTTNLPVTLVQATSLTKYYYKRSFWFQGKAITNRALDDVSFSLHSKHAIGLIGESGSGKSTLALSLAGLLPLTSGFLTFNGIPIRLNSRHGRHQLRSQVRLVFQNPQASLNPRKTILDSLGHSLLYHKLIQKEDLLPTVAEYLNLVGLSEDYFYRYPHQLSGGQQQRVSIARALLGAPQLIICDEIVSALDLSIQAQILNMLVQLQKKLSLTYLFISHDLAVVRSFCSEVLIMYKGQIIERGSTERIFSNPRHPYTRMLLNSQLPETPDQRNVTPALQEYLKDRSEPLSVGCSFYNRCPQRQESCKSIPLPEKGDPYHTYRCIH
ncbi:Glutathione import ATP-binding protein GsiA,dipeptide transporter ATP-binding subunit,ABC-type oligopeptide transport system, ATPase component,nickel import ATP-binding protein NikE,ABC transporter [Chlamydia serpentis]|uniref:Glutathione import ATP-binding protein GsiA,dipeptide transporter ATP-binding subunit,ABC-type oligopeptide transport system, ATPase component,nickel import ATP-binding protein NikE,ABC transporter n=1 Tax=Chlamydia serpentis TaxID=1967782 RepID=A0A2R8FBK5_9CHLA|nr:oligopeptide/dipeptide ABC transporter ATP-binding protein [Chlamydia serpentis]SPN73803.1 Glutathione import ATP-binding protein GsiA,dipeptide transporter ATP-binding subunit,ABC-type oligopeptide transport system, ATPase component,nickel import ATP-binding protein NikE,ABC transporter [Chlamydia serpentis]